MKMVFALRGRLPGVASSALVVVLAMGASVAPTASGADADEEAIEAVQSKIDDVSKELADAEAKLKATQAALDAARAKAADASKKMAVARSKRSVASKNYLDAKAKEGAARSELLANRADQAAARTEVGTVARTAFESGGFGNLNLTLEVLTSKSISSGAMALTQILMQRQQGKLEHLRSAVAAGEVKAAKLAAASRRASEAKMSEEAAVSAAAAAKVLVDEATQKLADLEAKQKRDKAALLRKKQEEVARLEALEAESRRVASLTTNPHLDPSSISIPDKKGFLLAPMPPSTITSPFGHRVHPVLGVRKLHAGADFPFACGTPVYASAAGTVIESGFNGVSGNHVVISHGKVNGVQLATAYMHFTQVLVSTGQKVSKGQQIGISGKSGRAVDCHLHFEVRENGVAVDPRNWMG